MPLRFFIYLVFRVVILNRMQFIQTIIDKSCNNHLYYVSIMEIPIEFAIMGADLGFGDNSSNMALLPVTTDV